MQDTNAEGRSSESAKRLDEQGREVVNALLRCIPKEEFELIEPALEHVTFGIADVLHSAGEPLDYAVFPNSGLTLLMVITSDARGVEVGMTGREGMISAQLTACHRLHEVEPRLARWLLSAMDRVGKNTFPITHESLALILGSGRPSITVAAGSLQKAGVIAYTRGSVEILDRPGLRRAACECYEVIRRLMQQVNL